MLEIHLQSVKPSGVLDSSPMTLMTAEVSPSRQFPLPPVFSLKTTRTEKPKQALTVYSANGNFSIL